ncbi:hypothetical protein MSAN_01001300 [Mycena sanguinolenta]|uniref:Uncharacterized protein n=1 Tax=Mycena sanguinolenta TaxID=230812 RepID=A0A8H6YT72_9AGAR|nr:hypothetical protein MSAN_01001300 [Mycena sanguinolenta]
MALRRRAMNNASTSTSTPNTPNTPNTAPSDSPLPPLQLPVTPNPNSSRASIGFARSPAATPSRSSNFAFDWDAARARKPGPYAMTPQTKARRSLGVPGTPQRRVVRKKSLYERITDMPSQIAFHIHMFPSNVPLPKPQTSAWIIGGTLHFIQFCVRITQIRQVPDSDLGWEDLYHEGEGHSWFDWTVPMTIFLLGAAVLNTIYLFTRIKLYRMHLRPDPVSSPNAKFVAAQLDFQPLEPPAAECAPSKVDLPPAYNTAPPPKVARVQQLEVWTPGELELMLFNVYSPVHAFLWMATGSSNWMIMIFIMGLVGAQANIMTHTYKALIKDKEIIAAEVFNEYNTGFVYPRVNPVRKDVAVMTHQSEVKKLPSTNTFEI